MTAPTRPPPWKPPSPFPTRFETPRLLLRVLTADDAPTLFRAIDESRDALLPWLPWVKGDHRTSAESLFHIERTRRCRDAWPFPPGDPNSGYFFGIFDKASGDLVGGTGFNRLDPDNLAAETGYWIRADRRCRGFATDACAASISWGFTPQNQGGFGFRRIHLFVWGPNTASRRVLAKLGLRQESAAKAFGWVEPLGWCDRYTWGVLHHEWDTERRCLRSPPAHP